MMKMIPVIFLCSILAISTSTKIDDDDSEENTSDNSHQTHNRLLVFPKSNIKFIVNPYNHDTDTKSKEILDSSEEIETRKPLMVKMMPQFKKHSLTTKVPVTRKPLMKFRTYTVKINSRGKGIIEYLDGEKWNNRERKSNKVIDNIKKSIRNKDKKEFVKMNTSEEKFKNKISSDILLSPPEPVKKKSKEEDQDRNEYIFLEVKKKNIVINDMPFDTEDDFETTTKEHTETKIRRKRSSNIIEEENMGTTITAFKYTGRDTRLTNELYFKNINH